MATGDIIYKIRHTVTGQFSHGVVQARCRDRDACVKWSRKGKEWTSEKNVKAHLTKAIGAGVNMANWEILELQYLPTKPINDWFDAKMLVKLLKK